MAGDKVAGDIDVAGRFLTAESTLGAGAIVPLSVEAREAISTPFRIEVRALTPYRDIQPDDLLGKSVTIQIEPQDGATAKRHFNGVVSEFSVGALGPFGYRQLFLVLSPKFWVATQTRDSRIFQDKSFDQIIKSVLGDAAVEPLDTGGLTASYGVRPYTVQYRESAFDFVSRLMEEVGIFYFFKHEQGRHTMVLADAKTAYVDAAQKEVEYREDGGLLTISSWQPGARMLTGAWTLRDFNFETPSTDLTANAKTVLSVAAIKKLERYDHPGRYDKQPDGKTLATLRMEAEEAGHRVATGTSSCYGFSPGAKFKISDHPLAGETGKGYVLTRVTHSATDMTRLPGRGGEHSYANSFECLPDSVVFRPEARTPKPYVHGPQTAMVTGPSGEEIYTDKYGRVKVQFHWDRLGKKDETTSCWLRVAQAWAGKQWGAFFLPRVGHEVVVAFLDGDPDRPLVVGSVYNAEAMPPWALPANQTKSGWVTRSSKEGAAADANEWRFEDKKGSEEVFLHAQKDLKVEVENDETREIQKNRTTTIVEGNETFTITKGDRSETLTEGNDSLTLTKGNRTVKLTKGDDSLTLTEGKQTITLTKGDRSTTLSEGNDSLTLTKGNRTLKVADGKETITVKADRAITVEEGNQSLTVTKGNRTVSVDAGDDSLTVKSGNITIKATGGKVTVEAGQEITLKVGANSVKIDAAGVTIKGTQVKVEGQASVNIKGAMAEVAGDGMLTLKGGVVNIN
ncbi:MAG: type VI secretion system spike protein VgrG1b [Thalassobaculales bacterium]